jgi:hypothetical protein
MWMYLDTTWCLETSKFRQISKHISCDGGSTMVHPSVFYYFVCIALMLELFAMLHRTVPIDLDTIGIRRNWK